VQLVSCICAHPRSSQGTAAASKPCAACVSHKYCWRLQIILEDSRSLTLLFKPNVLPLVSESLHPPEGPWPLCRSGLMTRAWCGSQVPRGHWGSCWGRAHCQLLCPAWAGGEAGAPSCGALSSAAVTPLERYHLDQGQRCLARSWGQPPVPLQACSFCPGWWHTAHFVPFAIGPIRVHSQAASDIQLMASHRSPIHVL
jgi:hypothetical protein